MLYHTRAARAASVSLCALSLSLLAAPAWAQDEPAPAEDESRDSDDFHDNVILITAGGLRRLDVLAGTSVVDGQELQRNLDGQIGEVLARQPGVSATSFS